MFWLPLVVVSSFCVAFSTAINKKIIGRGVNELVSGLWLQALALPLFYLAVLLNGIPEFGPDFLWATVVSGLLNIAAVVCIVKAIKHSPLALTVPYLGFTPVFLLATSWWMLGEFPSSTGLIGILLVVVGALLLHKEKGDGFFSLLKNIWGERGSRYMLLASLIFSFSSNLDKIAVLNSSVIFYPAAINSVIVLGLIVIVYHERKQLEFFAVKKHPRLFLLAAFSFNIMIFTHVAALPLTIVPYLVSVKRLSGIFSILLGYILFREEKLGQHLLGGVVMFFGVALIALG
ncbi:EamA family transporter [Candidatus Altiarchaeota archaeon]